MKTVSRQKPLLYAAGLTLFLPLLSPLAAAAAVVPAPTKTGAPLTTSAETVRYVPSQTRVLVLPIVNQSGEKDRKQRADQTSSGQKELARQFQSRGFQVMDSAETEKALADLKIDLTDEENQNRATLYKIGDTLKADLVAFAVITNVDQKRVHPPFGDDSHQLESRANVKVWLLDAKRQYPLLSATRQEAQAKNIYFASFDSGARLIRKSVEGAVRDSLKDVLAAYPIVSK